MCLLPASGTSVGPYQARGQMVNSVRHCAMPEEDMKPAIRSKRRGMLTHGVVLHHESVRPHIAEATAEMIHKLKFELLPTQHIVHTSPRLIIILWDRSKMRYVDTDLQTMETSRTQCTRGFAHNRNHPSQMASGSSWAEVISVWRS